MESVKQCKFLSLGFSIGEYSIMSYFLKRKLKRRKWNFWVLHEIYYAFIITKMSILLQRSARVVKFCYPNLKVLDLIISYPEV